jgi:hypothetical protein
VIRFLKDNTNNVIVTVTENSTVTNPIYLFLFQNQTTFDKYYFIATDISTFKERYNKFIVTEKNNPNTLSGEVRLGFKGFYNYFIYQTNLANTSGLANAAAAVLNITKTVEVGTVQVVISDYEIDEYEVQDTTNIVYQPDDL